MAQVLPGGPYPLGATYDGAGTNFAVHAEVAEAVELCLFDPAGRERKIQLHEQDGFVWHAYLPGIGPGQRYGYRVFGPYDPALGLRSNPHKLLVDPYAREVSGPLPEPLPSSVFGYRPDRPGEMSDEDSAPDVPKAQVPAPFFDWLQDRPPATPYEDSLLYEADARRLAGSFAGVTAPSVVDRLRQLGVTAVLILDAVDPLSWFAPNAALATAGRSAAAEFRTMVRELHDAGLEVLIRLDFDDSADGDDTGPTLGLKGIDNRSYYLLDDEDPRIYAAGVGLENCLNPRSPAATQLVLDCLRHWVTEMHVDGFELGVDPGLIGMIRQDPVVGRVKLIGDWLDDLDREAAGTLPDRWAERSARFRETAGAFWTGGAPAAAELVSALLGSGDRYGPGRYSPATGVNCFFGGMGDEHLGVVTDPRLWRNLLATVVLARGTPALTTGDELGPGEDASTADPERLAFARQVVRLRAEHPVFRRTRWLTAADLTGATPEARLLETGEPAAFGLWLDGRPRADEPPGADALLAFNAGDEPVSLRLPGPDLDRAWRPALDTSGGAGPDDAVLPAGAPLVLPPNSLVVLLAEDEPVRPGEDQGRADMPAAR